MEKMRDATHFRAYTRSEWIEMVENAGFKVIETKVFHKTHDFDSWARRAGLRGETIKNLVQYFIKAPAKVHDYFQIETFAGEVESYTDRKILIYATRLDKK
jgi:hypothetical protein